MVSLWFTPKQAKNMNSASSSHPPAIEIADLAKSYREGTTTHAVLDGASATVATGEIIVLLGRSGSGKSTLLNLLSGIDLPDAGTITVAGRNLGRLSEHERTLFRRRHIGFVFQFFNLIPTLTVLENLLLPLELNGRDGRDAADHARSLLNQVGLSGREDGYPDRLSGGEQQRVAISRALVHDPDLILADEPTGNLDIDTGRQVIDLLDRLVRKRGKTMVMATHSREVIGLADRILTVRDGGLVEVPRESVT